MLSLTTHKSLLPPNTTNRAIILLLLFWPIWLRKITSHESFGLHSSNDEWEVIVRSMFMGPLNFFWESPVHVLCPTFLGSVLIISKYPVCSKHTNPLLTYTWQIFSPVCHVLFKSLYVMLWLFFCSHLLLPPWSTHQVSRVSILFIIAMDGIVSLPQKTYMLKP